MTTNKSQPRKFEYSAAVRRSVPLLVGINGPSSCGKTKSALRLATGIQRVVGGDVAVIDTEANRSLHYAPMDGQAASPPDSFAFHHIPMLAPFGPDDYLAAVQYAISKGAKTIIIDSASHLHEGPGGVLEMHEEELQRMGGSPSASFAAWARPKAALRHFINSILQMHVNLIFCFRAKNKIKIEKGAREVEKLGFMPIASEEFIYEQTLNILLYPGSRGVPTWQTSFPGEQSVIKLPGQFQNMFGARAQLDEEIGEKLARWAAGGDTPAALTNEKNAKLAADWITFWGKKGIGVDRILAAVGKAKVEHLDPGDFARLTGIAQRVKAKELTSEQAFAGNAPPPDDPEPEADDEEEANRRAAEPTAEEIAAMDAAKTNGAGAGKVA